MTTYPKFFFDAAQGALLRQDHPDELTYYYLDAAALRYPPGGIRRAWELSVHAEQGYCIEDLLSDEWKMCIPEEHFAGLLSQCQISPVSMNNPLPSWFSRPSKIQRSAARKPACPPWTRPPWTRPPWRGGRQV